MAQTIRRSQNANYEISDSLDRELIDYSAGEKISGTCYNCNEEYEHLWMHWSLSDCGHPELEEWVMDVAKGLLMGDGTLRERRADRNSYIQLSMTNVPYMEWLAEKLQWMFGDLYVRETGEEVGTRAKESGFSPNAVVEDYRDVWQMKTRSHPDFNSLRHWYTDDGKRFPEDLELTPTIAKHWYAGDGSLAWGNGITPSLRIISSNEAERSDYLVSLFEEQGFSPYFKRKALVFNKEDTFNILDWMGDAPPGFEYKWEVESFDDYKKLKAETYGDQ